MSDFTKLIAVVIVIIIVLFAIHGKLKTQNKILQEQNALIKLQIKTEHPELTDKVRKIEAQFKIED